MNIIEASFIRNKEDNQHAGGHPDCQPDDINKGKCFILQQIPPRGDQIVSYHITLDSRFVYYSMVNW